MELFYLLVEKFLRFQ